jgi:hypothetical protein
MVSGVKPDAPPPGKHDSWQPPADLRAAIDAAEERALLSPEAFLRWLEGRGDELDSAPAHAAEARQRRNDPGA